MENYDTQWIDRNARGRVKTARKYVRYVFWKCRDLEVVTDNMNGPIIFRWFVPSGLFPPNI